MSLTNLGGAPHARSEGFCHATLIYLLYSDTEMGVRTVAKVNAFYSVNESKKPSDSRRHHNNDQCPAGRDIPASERRQGTGGYKLCEHCEDLR